MARRRSVALAVCALVLALAACGGGGSDKLTKAGYDAKVSKLCLLAADQFREMHLTNTIADWQHYAAKIVHVRVHFDNALAALKPPSSIKSDAANYLGASKNILEDDRYAIAGARAGDMAGLFGGLREDHTDNRAADRFARAIGATGCYIP
jgi:hypothetical protein